MRRLWALRNRRPAGTTGPYELPVIGALPFLLRHRGRILEALLAQARLLVDGETWSIKWLGEKPSKEFGGFGGSSASPSA